MNEREKYRRAVGRLSPDDRARSLERRAVRTARRGQFRKAIVMLRQAANIVERPCTWVRLAHVLRQDGRSGDAADALRRALWLHRHSGRHGRARTVAKLILAVDPECPHAARVIEAPVAA